MFSRLMPKNIDFFDLFDRHADTVLEAATTMKNILEDLRGNETGQSLERVSELEHECDAIAHMAVDLLRRSFITPFEREEIRELLSTMDDIVDYIEATAHRLVLYEIKEVPSQTCELCDVLVKTQEEVVQLVHLLRQTKAKKNLDFQQHCKEINRLENEGDRLHRSGIAALFRDGLDALTVIKLKEVYEMLESAIDSCEDVAQVIEGIIIEHVG